MKKLLFCLVIIGISICLAGCGGSSSGEDHHSGTATLTVVNNSLYAVNVYMDGTYYLSLYRGEAGQIINISTGSHTLAAYRQTYTDHYVNGSSFTASSGQSYTWTIT